MKINRMSLNIPAPWILWDITVIHEYSSTNHWLTRPSWRCFNCGSPGITMLWLMWHFRNLIEVLDRNSTLWTWCFLNLKSRLRLLVLHRSTRTKCTEPNKGLFAIHIHPHFCELIFGKAMPFEVGSIEEVTKPTIVWGPKKYDMITFFPKWHGCCPHFV